MVRPMPRTNIDSGTPWEELVGYSRAVRVGNQVFVTGTIAADEQGLIVAPGDAYQQAVYIIRKIEQALGEAGAGLEHVVRTRMYLLSLDHADEVGRAHREAFESIRPCATMLAVADLFTDEALVEIEVDAVIEN